MALQDSSSPSRSLQQSNPQTAPIDTHVPTNVETIVAARTFGPERPKTEMELIPW